MLSLTLLLAIAYVGSGLALATYVALVHAVSRWQSSSDRYAARMSRQYAPVLLGKTPTTLRRALLASTVGFALAGAMLGDAGWQRVLLATAGVVLGYQTPALVLRALASRRLTDAGDQLGPALVLMASGLQAGLSLTQAIELAVRESPSPLADELAIVVKEIHLGTPFDDALRGLPRRLPIEDVQLAVEAILTLRQTGADLVTTFRLIADTIAERMRVEGRIRVSTSEGMLQGIVMCLIPPVMLLIFRLADPSSVRPLLGHPVGWAFLALVAALNATGFVLMRRVARVRV